MKPYPLLETVSCAIAIRSRLEPDGAICILWKNPSYVDFYWKHRDEEVMYKIHRAHVGRSPFETPGGHHARVCALLDRWIEDLPFSLSAKLEELKLNKFV